MKRKKRLDPKENCPQDDLDFLRKEKTKERN